MSGTCTPRQAHIRIAAAIMILLSQWISVRIRATVIRMSVRHVSRSSSFVFSSPLIYYPVIHDQED